MHFRLFVLASFCQLLSYGQGINFVSDSTLVQLKNRALAENKPIFIDCYTSWCGPCKWMAANTFKDPAVGAYFDANFVSAKIDMEKGHGPSIANYYKVNAYPTFLFLDKDGNMLHRSVGGQSAEEFISNARESMDPAKRFGELRMEYQNGNRDLAFLRTYITACDKAGFGDSKELLDWYFASMSESEMNSLENLLFMTEQIWNIRKETVAKIDFTNRQLTVPEALAAVDAFFVQYYDAQSSSIYDRVKGEDGFFKYVFNEDKYRAMYKEIEMREFASKQTVLLNWQMILLGQKSDFKGQLNLCLTMPVKDSWYNSVAWNIYENSDDKADLKAALGLAKIAAEKVEEFPINAYNAKDTYAALQYKLGMKEAKASAEKAIKFAEENKLDATATVELMAKYAK